MTSLALHEPMRTPSPKIRIHRSQSFGSPASRMSVTPIDESPYSKSASAIGLEYNFPEMNVLAASHTRPLIDRRMSDDSTMGDTASTPPSPTTSELSSSTDSEGEYGLFISASPAPPSHPRDSTHVQPGSAMLPSPPHHIARQIEQYQDPSTPMHDPWLVRLVLNLYDERGFAWMDIAECVGRCWGVRTGSAEVLGILSRNGRVERCWWD